LNILLFVLGVRRRVAAIKDRLRECHKTRRLSYANQMINWTLVDWSRVIFIDEFRISSGDSGRLWVCRENGTRYEERNITLVDRTFRFSVFLYSCEFLYTFIRIS
jgi:hypothetical protein